MGAKYRTVSGEERSVPKAFGVNPWPGTYTKACRKVKTTFGVGEN
jgi:hypothetical protein